MNFLNKTALRSMKAKEPLSCLLQQPNHMEAGPCAFCIFETCTFGIHPFDRAYFAGRIGKEIDGFTWTNRQTLGLGAL